VRAARDRGSDIRSGTELVSFEQDGAGVTALVRSRETGNERNVRADYFVAADGPRGPRTGRAARSGSGSASATPGPAMGGGCRNARHLRRSG